jgi:hypothetical protein
MNSGIAAPLRIKNVLLAVSYTSKETVKEGRPRTHKKFFGQIVSFVVSRSAACVIKIDFGHSHYLEIDYFSVTFYETVGIIQYERKSTW